MSNDLLAKIDEAKNRAARLRKLSAAADEATRARDITLYKLFGDLHVLDVDLRKLDRKKSLKMLKEKYRIDLRGTIKSANVLLQIICPELSIKKRAKYAAMLRYIRVRKKPDEKVKLFVRKSGGINGCVSKEKELRAKSKPPRAFKT